MLDLPQPPTDNLYKFLAVFGLVLFLASGLLLWSQNERWVGKTGEIVQLEKKIEFNAGLTSSSQPIGTANAEHAAHIDSSDAIAITHLNELKASQQSVLCVGKTGALIGFFLMAAGFYWWYTKAQRYQDRVLKAQAEYDAKRLEEEKSKLLKTVQIHKIQAQLEIAAYRAIWRSLVRINHAAIAVGHFSPADTSQDAHDTQKELADRFQAYTNVFERWRPFYPQEIYTVLAHIQSNIRVEHADRTLAARGTHGAPTPSELFQNRNTIMSLIETACSAIRNRLAVLTVPEAQSGTTT